MADIPPCYGRYPELDGCRGIAIFMMVIFHLVFDLSYFSLCPIEVSSGFWRYFGYSTAALFVLIAGVAVSIRSVRIPREDSLFLIALPFIRRGFFLIVIGAGITLVTWIYLQGTGYIIFGILHLIGTATILAPFFFRLKRVVIIPGILLILAGWLETLPEGPIWLVFTGIHPAGFYSVDYTPLIPWFGVFLVGMAAGYQLYPEGKRAFLLSPRFERFFLLPAYPGRHSLMIYLVHQPVLIGLLMVLSGKTL